MAPFDTVLHCLRFFDIFSAGATRMLSSKMCFRRTRVVGSARDISEQIEAEAARSAPPRSLPPAPDFWDPLLPGQRRRGVQEAGRCMLRCTVVKGQGSPTAEWSCARRSEWASLEDLRSSTFDKKPPFRNHNYQSLKSLKSHFKFNI